MKQGNQNKAGKTGPSKEMGNVLVPGSQRRYTVKQQIVNNAFDSQLPLPNVFLKAGSGIFKGHCS